MLALTTATHLALNELLEKIGMRNTIFQVASAAVLCLAVIVFTGAPIAQATTVFQEDFSGATPGTYGAGVIPGANFAVSSGNIDIVGVLNGSFFSCVGNASGNCLDLIGNVGFGAIGSTIGIDLIAGHTYTISYTSILQGFSPGPTPNENYSVGLGTNLFTEIVGPSVTPNSISFVEGTTQLGASLTFASITNLDNVHGPVLSDITVTDSPPAAVPGPNAGAGLPGLLLAAGAIWLIGWRRKPVTAR